MAIDVSKLSANIADLKAAFPAVVAALDDLAAKVAAIPTEDPATQAAIDAAAADASAIKDGLLAAVAKDDPAPITPAA